MTKMHWVEKVMLAIIGVLILGVFGLALNSTKNKNNFGAISIPDSPYLFITTLQSSIGSSDTSMTLNLGTFKNGTSLSGYQCFTLDSGTATAEYVCGTASGTAISSLLRGIDPQNPAATSTSLAFSHRRGADVRITDFPILQVVKRLVNGQDAFPSRLSMDTSIATSSFTTYNLVTKQYTDGVALQGAPTATTTGNIPGVVALASGIQLSNGTAMSGAYTLVAPASFFSYSPQSATSIPVSNASGKINVGYLDLSAYTGALAVTGTSTLATTTVSGVDVGTHLSKFGGTGADGALNITSGTTTIDCANQNICVKNYTSITISGTGALAFKNMASTTYGTVVILKSQGNVTVTSTNALAIDLRNGGGNSGVTGYGLTVGARAGGGGASAVGGTAGLGTLAAQSIYHSIPVNPGAGGGASFATNNPGGTGGGGLLIEVGGALNFANGTINASGGAGSGANSGTGVGAGGGGGGGSWQDGATGGSSGSNVSSCGGGGGGGSVFLVYNTLTANSGTITVSGGSGTCGLTVSGGAGGAGMSLVIKNTEY